MTINELRRRVRRGDTVIVEFTKEIENYETCIDEGMRAIVVKVDNSDGYDCSKVHFDLKPFDEYNDDFAQANYFDKNGAPTETAKENGQHPVDGIEYCYFADNLDIVEFVEIDQIVEN